MMFGILSVILVAFIFVVSAPLAFYFGWKLAEALNNAIEKTKEGR